MLPVFWSVGVETDSFLGGVEGLSEALGVETASKATLVFAPCLFLEYRIAPRAIKNPSKPICKRSKMGVRKSDHKIHLVEAQFQTTHGHGDRNLNILR